MGMSTQGVVHRGDDLQFAGARAAKYVAHSNIMEAPPGELRLTHIPLCVTISLVYILSGEMRRLRIHGSFGRAAENRRNP